MISLSLCVQAITYGAVRDKLYQLSDELVNDGTPEDVRGTISAWKTYEATLQQTIGEIFSAETCGDGLCQYTDENPFWDAGDHARTFPSCETDCGAQPTTDVTFQRTSF